MRTIARTWSDTALLLLWSIILLSVAVFLFWITLSFATYVVSLNMALQGWVVAFATLLVLACCCSGFCIRTIYRFFLRLHD